MKKYLAWILAAVLIICMTACGSNTSEEVTEDASQDTEQTEETTEENADVAGGWTITENEAAAMPSEVQEAFDKAMADDNSGLIPVAYFGRQVVAGYNYAVLCRDPSAGLKVAIIYADLEGGAKLSYLKDFNIGDYTGGEDGQAPAAEELTGGWEAPEDYSVIELPEDADEAFDAALETFLGNDLDPMVCLGTQVVSGTNYAILCHSVLTTEDPVESIQLVTIYKDLDGNSYINNIVTVDPATFNE